MAASEKTAVLGLSLWAGTDKPRRLDFVEDNEALEALVGGHLQNEDMHLNAARMARVDAPLEVRTYTGTGTESRSLVLDFAPQAVIVFAVGKGPAVYNGTYTRQYAGFSAGGQHSSGVKLNSIQVTVMQEQAAPEAGGSMAALNESGVSYAVIAFR